jgi:hypothetical protein
MTARSGTYDGPLIGTAQSITLDLLASANHPATFDFGGAPVVPGTVVTFSQELVSGPGPAYYNPGPCDLGDLDCTECPGVYMTTDTTPPLSEFRRRSVAVTITQVQFGLYLPLVTR